MIKTDSIDKTPTSHSDIIPRDFRGCALFLSAQDGDAVSKMCRDAQIGFESWLPTEEDIDWAVDMCRVDRYFDPCYEGDWTDCDISPSLFATLAFKRATRLAHTFWGVQSHLASLGIEPNERLSVDFVKRAVSAYIEQENGAFGQAVDFEGQRLEELGPGTLDDEGYNEYGRDRDGYDKRGFNRDGVHRNGTLYDEDGYNQWGCDKKGYDRDGWDRDGYNRETCCKYDLDGYLRDGFNDEGFDRDGYDRDGFDWEGWSREGINRETGTRYDRWGYDIDSYNRDGWDRWGRNRETGTRYDRAGYDRWGFDRDGYDRDGYDDKGLDRDGYDRI